LIYFIVNPAAGSGRVKTAVPVIERIMQEKNISYSIINTEGPGDFARISGLIDYNKASAVICVGGDGTIQEYIGLAVNRDISFGIIPAGSGNDLIYSIPNNNPNTKRKFASFEEKIIFYTNKITESNIAYVDAVKVNEDAYFFNIGGTGIDIQVLIDALPLKKAFGGGAYFLSLIKNVVTYNTGEMKLTVDGVAETEKILLLAICNGSYYGGGLKIAPSAVMNDGFLTLCKIKKMPRIKMMAMFPRVKSGGHVKIRGVSFVNCSTVKLEFDGKKTINLDGNLYDFESPLTFEIMKGAVRLII